MLRRTFCHLPGVGPRLERALWAAGVHTWDSLAGAHVPGVSAARLDRLKPQVEQSAQRLADGDARFFDQALPADQAWRLFAHFREQTAFVDIETTGLGGPGDHITSIALYDGRTVRTYVHGQNLDAFGQDIAPYQSLVTYNGKCFDVPFIRQALGLRLDQAHIDLRYVLRSLGYGGGLKGCEKQLGLDRGDLAGVDGNMAVLLWHQYRRQKNDRALETLLAYNVQDVLNLEILAVLAYNAKVKATPFGPALSMPVPEPHPNPFRADQSIVENLQGMIALQGEG